MNQQKMTVTLTIEADESELAIAWHLLSRLQKIKNKVNSSEGKVLRQIRETLESELEKSGYIPF